MSFRLKPTDISTAGTFRIGYKTSSLQGNSFNALATYQAASGFTEGIWRSIADLPITLSTRNNLLIGMLTSSSGGAWMIDDIVLTDGFQPTSLAASEVGYNTATVIWVANDASQWQVQYKATDATSWTTLNNTLTTTSYTLSDLFAGTSYDVQVRAKSPLGSYYSGWSETFTFSTLAAHFDFSATAPTGQTLYYRVIDAENRYVALTHPNVSTESESSPWSGFAKPTGAITLPETVTYNGTTYTVTAIDAYAFRSCTSLTGDLEIPNTVTSLGSYAFYGCTGFNGVLTLSEQLTEIPQSVFYGWQNITGELVIPNSVTAIGNNAFQDLRNISSLTLGTNVGSVGNSAFNHCINLDQIKVLRTNPPILQSSTFSDVPVSTIVFVPQGSLTAYQNAEVWKTFTNIVEQKLPDFSAVAPTGQTLYYTITDATNRYVAVTYPNLDAATPWEGYAMPTGELTIPQTVEHEGVTYTVTAIDKFAFCGCFGLTGTWSVPATVTSIGSRAYDGCTGFTGDLVIPTQMTSIGDYAFNGCTGLDKSLIFIPGNTLIMGKSCFAGCCNMLEVIPMNPTPPVASQSFNNFIGSNTRVYFPNSEYQSNYFATGTGWNMSSIAGPMYDLEKTVNGMKRYFFIRSNSGNNYFLTLTCPGTPKHPYLEDIAGYMGVDVPEKPSGELSIPDQFNENQYKYYIREIGAGAFGGCTGLTQVVIRGDYSTHTTVDANAFLDCTALTTLTIENVDVNENAFLGCPSLATINATYVNFLARAFANSTGLVTLNAGRGTIEERAFAGCTNLATLHPSALGSSGYGTAASIIGESAFEGCNITVGDGQTITFGTTGGTIAANAFNGCAFVGSNLKLSCPAQAIGASAFENQPFTSVTLSGATTIGASAFKGCLQITSLDLGGALTTIGASAFEGCSGITGGLDIPNTVTSIGSRAFYGCTGFTQVTSLNSNPATAEDDSFYGFYDKPLYISIDASEAYSSATGWRDFADVRTIIPPSDMTVDPNTATLSWIANGFSNFEVSYKSTMNNILSGSTTTVEVAANSYTINAQVGRLYYDFKVRGKATYYTDWVECDDWFLYGVEPVETMTEYFEENTGLYQDLPQYWYCYSHDTYYPQVESSSLDFQTYQYDQYVILRPISDMRGKSVIFSARKTGGYQTNPALAVGYLTNPTDMSTFVEVQSNNITSDNYVQYEILFNDYPENGSDCYVAFKLFKSLTNPVSASVKNIKICTITKRFYTTDTDNEWTEEDKWYPTGVPTLTDNVRLLANVRIDEGHIAQFNDCIGTGSITIEDGGQLVCNNIVRATVKKSITGYNNEGGWNFIASPVVSNIVPSEYNGFLTNEYDLYYYDEPTHYWRNHKSSENSQDSNFSIEPQKGYLYANNEGTTLSMTGNLQPSNTPVTIEGLSHAASTLTGFNLVGNPFTCNATIDRPYYVISGNNVVPYEGSEPIAPCTSVMVQADDEHESVTFTRAATEAQAPQPKNGNLQIALTQTNTRNAVRLDKAIVSFSGGARLEKFIFNTDLSKLYIPQGGKDYAIVSFGRDAKSGVSTIDINEIPVNFEAAKDGTYTLSFSNEDVEFSCLHLIDNLTGADIDLLSQPEYTFEAKYSDYPSRFKLVFAKGSSEQDDEFALLRDGHLVLFGIEGTSTLQVIDMLGHVLSSEQFSGSYDKQLQLVPGVYVIRLINGDKVKTQKIIKN